MIKFSKFAVILLALCCHLGSAATDKEWDNPEGYQPGKRVHQILLKNTDHELHIFKIFGRKPGNTILIIGGIHGNEPGAYLAASSYTDLDLKQGNLFVVPRANLYSILQNERGHSGDYNRKFASKLNVNNNDDKIISELKKLMEQSDCVLNLHDGSGFYRTKWIDNMNNPFRFGQSVIADCDVYTVPDSGEQLELGDIARRVVTKVNSEIETERYHFRFADHNSISDKTKYPDMRKTATFYALTQHNIPAFGVETSKSLPTDALRVEHQILVINAFLEEFDILPDVPAKHVEKARFDYLVLSVGDQKRFVVKNGETIDVPAGSIIRVDHLVGNYENMMFADIQDFGGKNDNGLEVAAVNPLEIVVRKDSTICGSIRVEPVKDVLNSGNSSRPLLTHFIVKVNEIAKTVYPDETLDVFVGDKVTIVDYISAESVRADVVNLKGFVGQPGDNRGEDRGFTANTSTDLMKDWSLDRQGKRYAIVARKDGRNIDTIQLQLNQPIIDYLVYSVGNQKPEVIGNNGQASVEGDSTITLHSLIGDSPLNIQDFKVFLNGKLCDSKQHLDCSARENTIELRHGGSTLFTFLINQESDSR